MPAARQSTLTAVAGCHPSSRRVPLTVSAGFSRLAFLLADTAQPLITLIGQANIACCSRCGLAQWTDHFTAQTLTADAWPMAAVGARRLRVQALNWLITSIYDHGGSYDDVFAT